MYRSNRLLVVEVVPKEQSLGAALAGEGSAHIWLDEDGRFPPEDGWRIVSHTLEIREDGDGILTMIYERIPPAGPGDAGPE